MLRRLLVVLVLALLVPGRSEAADAPSIDDWLKESQESLLDLYTHLHENPELSFQEFKTSERMADELRKIGAEVTTQVGKVGVVGVLKNGEGPTVLVRADMDALPVTEETGLPYASKAKGVDPRGQEVGVMHACGHDIHMTSLIGAARWLADHKDRWSGTIVFIAQPAEEVIGGARAMLDDGLYERFPKPDFALALHCRADREVGDLFIRPGPLLASSTSLDVVIRGRGGHGAWPEATVDPVVLSALAILDFQTIVSREIPPREPAVVTVGSIQGGTKHNIIPNEVKLQMTLRAYSEEVRLQLIEGIERRVKALAEAHGAPAPSVEVREHAPATINDPELTARVRPSLEKALGENRVFDVDPVMGSEDFGLYAKDDVPILMLWIGTISPERIQEAKDAGQPLPGLHSSRYYPEPVPSFSTGIRAMTAAVTELLPPNSDR